MHFLYSEGICSGADSHTALIAGVASRKKVSDIWHSVVSPQLSTPIPSVAPSMYL